tara:strand:- start:163 stop:381 length:219 start_codon:yes stop_codon:yes gene_type:complete
MTMIKEVLNIIQDKPKSTREIQEELIRFGLQSIKMTLNYLYKKGRVVRHKERRIPKPRTGPTEVYKYAAKKD